MGKLQVAARGLQSLVAWTLQSLVARNDRVKGNLFLIDQRIALALVSDALALRVARGACSGAARVDCRSSNLRAVADDNRIANPQHNVSELRVGV